MAADSNGMIRRRTRSRTLDAAVVLIALACCTSPLIAWSSAAAPDSPIIQTKTTVDQKVLETAMISNPLNGDFRVSRSGRAVGSVDWDVFTTSRSGYKLLVSALDAPAMRSTDGKIGDYSHDPSAWNVSGNDRAFGFSARGVHTMSVFGDGANWRGFDGRREVEVARKYGTAVASTRTTVRLSSEMGRSLPASSSVSGTVVATAVLTL